MDILMYVLPENFPAIQFLLDNIKTLTDIKIMMISHLVIYSWSGVSPLNCSGIKLVKWVKN